MFNKLIIFSFYLLFITADGHCAADFFGLGKRLYDDGKYTESAGIFEKACFYGNSDGCISYAEMLDNGLGVKKDSMRAAEFYQKGCELGFNNDRNSCIITGLKYTLIGLSFETGTGFEPNIRKAFEAYKAACRYEGAQGCTNLARFYEEGLADEQSFYHAAQSYQKACGMGDGAGCFGLGRMFESGRGVSVSTERAVKYFEKACLLKNADGCEAFTRIKLP